MNFAYFQNLSLKDPPKLEKIHEIPWYFQKHTCKMLEPHWKHAPLPAHSLYSSQSVELKQFPSYYETPCTMTNCFSRDISS